MEKGGVTLTQVANKDEPNDDYDPTYELEKRVSEIEN